MQFRQTVIWKDIEKILTQGVNNYPIGVWNATIHTVEKSFNSLKVTNVDIEKDFVNNYTEVILLTILLDRGTYQTQLYPYLDNLEITLTRYPQRNNSSYQTTIQPDFKQKYKAIFLPKENDNPLGNIDEMNATIGTQLLKPVFAYFQLMNLNVEPMRLKYVSGSILGYPPEMLLSSVINHETSMIKLPTGKVIDKIDIVKPDNSANIQNLVMPSDLNILEFPTFVHEFRGIYNSGSGTFVSGFKDPTTKKITNKFNIYPTHKSVTKNRSLLYLYNLPHFELMYNDTTFSIKGNAIHAIGHIDQGYRESKQATELSQGMGFRMTDASSFMTKPVKMTPKGPIGEQLKLNFKVVTKGRPDGFNLANRTDEITSSNPYKQYSNYVKQVGNYIFFRCTQIDTTYLEPSMPVTLYRLIGNSTVKQKCTLIGFKSVIQMKDKGTTNRAGYLETTMLTLFVTGLDGQQ